MIYSADIMDDTALGAPLIAVVDSGYSDVADARVVRATGIVADTTGELLWDSDITDENGHGSRCTRLILQRTANGRVWPIKILSKALQAPPAALTQAIALAAEGGAKLINLSLGTKVSAAIPSLYRVCAEAAQVGIILVAARPPMRASYPADFDCVVSVGAARYLGPHEHQRGGGLTEFFANGWPTDSDSSCLAASFAAPRITGIIANWAASNPAISLAEARARLATIAGARGEDGIVRPGGLSH